MIALRQRLLLVPVTLGLLGLAAACSSNSPAPNTSAPTQPVAVASVAATRAASVQASAPAQAGASARASAPVAAATTQAPAGAGGNAPVRVASALAIAATRSGQGQAASKIDACSLVTSAEASAAAGVPMPHQHGATDGTSCEYTGDDPLGFSVTIEVDQIGGKGSFDRTSTTVAANRLDVPGVGDGAYIITGLQMMYVLKGNTLLRIQLANPSLSDDVYRAALKTMAQAALGRL